MMTKGAKGPEQVDERLCENVSLSSYREYYAYTFRSCYFNSWQSK